MECIWICSLVEAKESPDKEGDEYMASSITHVDHEACFVDLGTSFHMNPHMQWIWKCERFHDGDVFLGSDLTTRISGKAIFTLVCKFIL